MRVVGIDPGARVCGVVVLDGPDAMPDPYLIRSIDEVPTCAIDLVVIERMQARGAVPPQDLIDVSSFGGMVAGAMRPRKIHSIMAVEWKGNLMKKITDHRLDVGLAERAQLGAWRDALAPFPRAHHKELYDALGILLVGSGLLGKGCAR